MDTFFGTPCSSSLPTSHGEINKNCARFVGSQAGAKDFHLCPVAELQKVARDEKVSFGMATLHFVGKFESQVYYQTLWYSYYYTLI